MLKNKVNILQSYKLVLNKKYLLVYFIYFSFFIFNGPLEQVMPLLFNKMNFNETIYGVFLSANNVIHIILPSAVAYIASKFNAFKISIIAMILSLLGAFTITVLPEHIIYIFPFALLIFGGRTIFNFSLGNKINYTLPEKNRGKYFAMRDLFLFGAISLGLFFGGLYTSRFGIKSLYRILSIGFMIPLVLISLANKKFVLTNTIEEADECGSDEKSLSRKSSIKFILYDKKVWAFIIIEICTTIYASAMSFLPLFGTQIGISVSSVMTMFGAVTIVNSLIALILGHFSDMSGRKWIYILDIAFDMIPATVFAFTSNITIFVIGITLTMIKDALAPMSFAYFYDCFPEEKAVLVMGVLSSIGNAMSFLTPIFVGIIWAISTKYVFLTGAIGNCIAAVVAIFMLPNIKTKENMQL